MRRDQREAAESIREFALGLPGAFEDFPWGERSVSFFLLEGETVWGATARILRQLLLVVTGTEDPYADGHAHPQL